MEEASAGATALENASKIPIAQLDPLQSEPSTRAIKAVVTLTWPYSSATGTVAFLLSEPDFRLRRTRGQVRVQFAGSSAKAVKKAGVASGDEVTLSLDGVEWIHNETTVATPGRGVDFELKFTERLLLQFKQEDSEELKRVDIDHPAPEPEVTTPLPATISEHDVQLASPALRSQNQPQLNPVFKDNEYSSPAFIKRARTSYGSMFDSDYDPFTEEDGTVAGRGRKRTRLSSSWRYSSRSPTPGVEATPEAKTIAPEVIPKETPVMTDEACQTTGLEEGNAAETLANFARQATNVGVVSYPDLNAASVPEVSVQPSQPVVHQQPTEDEVLEQAAVPPSPNLTPLPSELLPEISPILTHEQGFNAESTLQTDLVENQIPNAQEEAPSEADPSFAEEDIYTASPQRMISISAFTSVNPVASTRQPRLDQNYVPENLYGQWQGEPKQKYPEPPSSPQFVDEVGLSTDGREREFEGEDDIQSPNYEAPDEPQYPDLDDVMQDIRPTGWAPEDSLNGYPPPVPGPGGRFGDGDYDEIYAPPPPRSVAMSRSQSARSNAIDLTESSDEEEEQIDGPMDEGEDYDDDEMQGMETNPIYPGPGYAERAQAEDDEEDEESEEDGEDEIERADRAAQVKQQYAQAEEEEFDDDGYAYTRDRGINPEYEDEEEFSDDEEDVQNPYPLGLDPALQEDFYDEDEAEEESYDEDEEDEEPRVQRAPVVIDLLSSDDEDGAPAPKPASTQPTVSDLQPQTASQIDEEDEESEEDEDEDEDEEMDYEENITSDRRPSDTRLPQQHFIDEEDEDAVFEDESVHDEPSEEDEDEEVEVTPRKATNFRGSQQPDEEDEELNDSRSGQLEGPFVDTSTPKVMQQKDPNRTGRPLPPMPKPPPPRSNLFSRMFNLDGANDGNEEGLYPILPRIPSPPVVTSEAEPTESLTESKPSDQDNTQLPTPDATQVLHKPAATDSQVSDTNVEASFETTIEQHEGDELEPSQSAHMVTQTEIVEALASRPTSSGRASITPAPTIKIEPMEFFSEPSVVNQTFPSSAQVEIFESMEVEEETTTVLSNDDNALPVVEQETQTLVIIEEAEKITIEAVEPSAGDNTAENLESIEREEETATVLSNDVDIPTIAEQDTETTMIDEDAKRIAIEVLERNREDDATETFDDDLLAVNYPRATRSATRSQSPAKRQNGHAEPTIVEPVYTRESPRRSHRRARSTASTAHSEAEVRPVTPVKEKIASEPKSLVREITPIVVITAQATPKSHDASIWLSQETPLKGHDASTELAQEPPTKGHDASIELAQDPPTKGHDASIELALSLLDSPDKRNKRDLRTAPVVDLKLRLSRILRTELSEFTSLKVLRYHINKKLDVLAVATTSPPEATRAKSGPRNYLITFNIADPSTAPSSVTQVQVFRPYKDALPVLQAGDGILLRNFQVVAIKNKGFGLRSVEGEGSSWAVFRDGKEEVRGPPVEFGEKERGYMTALKGWYAGLDGEAKKKIMRANGEH